MPDRCPDAYVTLAHDLADAAGGIVRSYFRQSYDIVTKPDSTPVTEADRAAEQAMRAILEEREHDHGIFGEEFGTVRADAEYVWYLDPIDGTKAFIAGVPVFGTLIGLARHGRPVPAPPPHVARLAALPHAGHDRHEAAEEHAGGD